MPASESIVRVIRQIVGDNSANGGVNSAGGARTINHRDTTAQDLRQDPSTQLIHLLFRPIHRENRGRTQDPP